MADSYTVGGVLVGTKHLLDADSRQAVAVTISDTPSPQAARIEQLLSVNGDGTGNTDMISGTGIYKIQPGAGTVHVLSRVNVYIEDGVNEKFDAVKYGATEALTNGLSITVQDGSGTLTDYTPLAIKRIGQWSIVAGVDMDFTDFAAGAADYCSVRWTFRKGGGPVVLDGDNSEFFAFELTDDLGAGGAALVSHVAQVQGYAVTK